MVSYFSTQKETKTFIAVVVNATCICTEIGTWTQNCLLRKNLVFMSVVLRQHLLLHYHVCSTHIGSTMCSVVNVFLKRGHKYEFPNIHHAKDCGMRRLKYSSWSTFAGFIHNQPVLYVHMCMYVRRCGSLYHVGIRPLALVLITLSCLLRPCNLPPLKCGF